MKKNKSLRNYITEQEQMSESMVVSAFLAFSGGFQDAYTFIARGGVFANAQTGNVVLMSTSFLQGKWRAGLLYLYPILAFVAGVFMSYVVENRFHFSRKLHWRQVVLMVEIGILLVVGFLPANRNIPANALVSFSCAMQVQAFRTVGGGIPYASTMCVGNLRGGTAALAKAIFHKDAAQFHKSLYYFAVILIFALGAGVGALLSMHASRHIIWVCCALLSVAAFLMDLDRKRFKKQERI